MSYKNVSSEYELICQKRFSSYMKTAIYRHRAAYLIKKKKSQCYECDSSFMDVFQQPETDIQDWVDYEILRQGLRMLKQVERRILLAHVVEDKTMVQIAKELDMRYKTVTSLYYRTLKKLRVYMEEAEK